MGKYYKASTMPIIDYGFKLPFEELFTVVKYKQDRYDEALSKMQEAIIASGDLNAIPTSNDEAYIAQVRNQLRGLTTKYQNTDLALNYGKIMADINSIAADPNLIESQKSYMAFANDMKNYMTQANAGINNPYEDPRLKAKGYSTAEQGIWSAAPMPYTSPDAIFKSMFDEAGEEYRNVEGLKAIANRQGQFFANSPEGIQAMQSYLKSNPDATGALGSLDELGLPTDPALKEALAKQVLYDGMVRFLDVPGTNSSSSSSSTSDPNAISLAAISLKSGQEGYTTIFPEGYHAVLGVEGKDFGPKGDKVTAYDVRIENDVKLKAGEFDVTTYDLHNDDGTLKEIDVDATEDYGSEIEWANQWSMAKQFFGSNEYQAYQSINLEKDTKRSKSQKKMLEDLGYDLEDLNENEINERFQRLKDTYSDLGMWTNEDGVQYGNLKKAYEAWLKDIENEPKGPIQQSTAYAMKHFPSTKAKWIPNQGKATVIDGKLQLLGWYAIPNATVKAYFEGLQKNEATGEIIYSPTGLDDHDYLFGKQGFSPFTGGFTDRPFVRDWNKQLEANTDWQKITLEDGGVYWQVAGYKEAAMNLENALQYDKALSGGAKLTDQTAMAHAFLSYNLINQIEGENKAADKRRNILISGSKNLFAPRTKDTQFDATFKSMSLNIARLGNNLNPGMKEALTDYLNEKQDKGMGTKASPGLSEDEINGLAKLRVYLLDASESSLRNLNNKNPQVKIEGLKMINYNLRSFYHDEIYNKQYPYKDVSSYKTEVPKLAKAYGLTKVETDDYSNLSIDSKVYAPYASENFTNKLNEINKIAQKQNIKLKVTGLFRSPAYNDKLPNAKKSDYYYRQNPNAEPDVPSFHTNGNAIDIGLQTMGGKEVSSFGGFLAELETLGLNVVRESDHYHISLK